MNILITVTSKQGEEDKKLREKMEELSSQMQTVM